MKKVTSIILGIITLTVLTGCSTKYNSSTESQNSISNSISTSTTSNDSVYIPFTLNDTSIYSSSFISNENSIIFTNWEDNNKISILEEPFPTNSISTNNIVDFFDHSATSLTKVNNIIYFGDTSNNSNLSSINLTDRTYTKLNSRHAHDITSLNNQEIIYLDIPESTSSNRKLYSYNIETNSDILLTSDNVGKYIINNNFILYQNLSDGSKLYKISTDGSNREKVTDYSVDSFAVLSSQIIASNSDDNNNLYLIDPSSLNSKRFTVLSVTDLKTFNNELYGINKSNYLCKFALNLESNEIKTTELSSDSINEYHPTDKGIFIQKSINVNNPYLIKNNN